MAYIKIFPIKITDKKAMDYIMNPDKTDDKLLVSSFACSPETADLEFALTRKAGKENVMDKGDNLAFHLIQSFKPGEVDATTAHALGKQFADEVLKGKYEYIISTHIDKGHVHNHIIFNATSFRDYHKYVSNKRSYHKICRISNRICQENGLITSMPKEKGGRSYKENIEYHRGNSWKAKLKVAVDKAIWTSVNYDEFLLKIKLSGYEIRQGKHLAFRAPEQKNFTYMKSLGSYYTEDSVQERLNRNRHKTVSPKNISRKVRLFIDISAFIESGNQKGFETWAKRNNLKQAALTFNYLSENNLLNYESFQKHIKDISKAVHLCEKKIDNLNNKISHQQVLQKRCDAYRRCRRIVRDGKCAPDPQLFKTQHLSEFQLHDTLKNQLSDAGITKIPSPERLSRELDQLENEKFSAIQELHRLENQQKTLDVVRSNFSLLLKEHDITNSEATSPEL